MGQRALRVLGERFPGRAVFDTAVSRALLEQVARGEAPESLRLYRPDAILAFSMLDRTRPGFAAALAAARRQRFDPVIRLAGGRAAVFHDETLAFAWCRPAADLRRGVAARFREMAEITAAALRRLGVDARIGAVPGEYCPGDYSVNASGRRKLMGVGQRVVRGAAHVGGVIVVRESRRVREVLEPVYAALELEFDPETVGAVEDEIGGATRADVVEALLAEFSARYALDHGRVEAALLARARRREPLHDPRSAPQAGAFRTKVVSEL